MLGRIRGSMVVVAAVVAAACGEARQTAGTAAVSCTRCHGGGQNESGAPPRDRVGRSDTSLPSVGAHTAHVQSAGLACTECHPDPRHGSTSHMDGRVDLAFGPLVTRDGALTPSYDPGARTCSGVYCHGAFEGGNAGNAPVWTSVGQGQAACGTCHEAPPPPPHPPVSDDTESCNLCHPDTVDANGALIGPDAGGKHLDGTVGVVKQHDSSWMDKAASGFHAFSANRGLEACERCHGGDLEGGLVHIACAQCHGASWKTNCVMCHGRGDNQTGAPPRATWGNGSDPVRIGAHSAHVAGGAMAPAFDCAVCHAKPADALAAGHIVDGTATVTFSGIASHGIAPATWDRGSATCASTYCHGGALGGGTNTTPVWTATGQGQAACGTCHGLPPPSPHPSASSDLTGCAVCHSPTVAPDGSLVAPIDGGKHLDGNVEVSGHGAGWMDESSPGFHGSAALQDRAFCQSCHGQALDGGFVGVACSKCHGSGPSSCTTCHRQVAAAGSRSSHFAGVAEPGDNCQGCHDPSPLPGGHFLLPAGGSDPSALCAGCHAGQGQTLGGQAPPLLVGWTDAVNGDFHGARAGTGYGGTLLAPFVRGQAPLPCLNCHDPHSSSNAFLLASTVNGTAVPGNAIDRAGVGAEGLCNACHTGDRHGTCASCHGADREPPGSPCLWCHGHEGIRFWTAPGNTMNGTVGCAHCHGFWQPQTEYGAPSFSQAPAVAGITATTALVSWRTNVPATTYVEYGVGTAGLVVGNGSMAYDHVVTLTGLAPSTAYAWRVRTSDQFRNVTLTAVQTFTTIGAQEVPRPDLGYTWAGTRVPNTTAVATLKWHPVSAPSGTAVQYEVQLASDPAFTYLVNAVLSPVDGSLATGNSGWIDGTPTTDGTFPTRPTLGFDVILTNLPQDDCIWWNPNEYYYRVRARDALGNVSDWSATGWFSAMAGDPYC